MEFVVMYSLSEGAERSRILETCPRDKAYFEAFRAPGGGLRASLSGTPCVSIRRS